MIKIVLFEEEEFECSCDKCIRREFDTATIVGMKKKDGSILVMKNRSGNVHQVVREEEFVEKAFNGTL